MHAQQSAVKIYTPMYSDGIIQDGYSVTPYDSATPGSCAHKSLTMQAGTHYQVAIGTSNTKSGFRMYVLLHYINGIQSMMMNVYNGPLGSIVYSSASLPNKLNITITDNQNNETVSGRFLALLVSPWHWPPDTIFVAGYFQNIQY